MPRNLWESENAAAAAAVAVGSGGDATRKAMFPTMWMSRGEEAWTTDSTGTAFISHINCLIVKSNNTTNISVIMLWYLSLLLTVFTLTCNHCKWVSMNKSYALLYRPHFMLKSVRCFVFKWPNSVG